MKAILLSAFLTLSAWAVTVGEIPKNTIIEGDNGGLAKDSSAWNSSSIRDKVYLMFYIDPDEKSTNEHFSKAIKAQEYDRSKFGSIAIVNLGATWKPNFIIEKILKSKQEEFPHTIYVKDKEKVIVNAWEVGDDASNILLFSKNGTLLFYKSGRMEDDDIQKVFGLIESNL